MGFTWIFLNKIKGVTVHTVTPLLFFYLYIINRKYLAPIISFVRREEEISPNVLLTREVSTVTKKILEFSFCLSKVGTISRTFRVFVDRDQTERLSEILKEKAPEIISSNVGLVDQSDLDLVSRGIEGVKSVLGDDWMTRATRPGGDAPCRLKVALEPGCSLDIYQFEHYLLGETEL